jgi:hypothetical protein
VLCGAVLVLCEPIPVHCKGATMLCVSVRGTYHVMTSKKLNNTSRAAKVPKESMMGTGVTA